MCLAGLNTRLLDRLVCLNDDERYHVLKLNISWANVPIIPLL